jgi:hypothetical protein
MANWLERGWDHVSKDMSVIMQAKATFGFAAAVLIAATAYGTWRAAGEWYSERPNAKDATIKYLEWQIPSGALGSPGGRHLNADQQERMKLLLQLAANETYSFQINTTPRCDECELFGEEIRTFFNGIPGWQAGGGPLSLSHLDISAVRDLLPEKTRDIRLQ